MYLLQNYYAHSLQYQIERDYMDYRRKVNEEMK
jgi:hypothetical protein